MRLEDIPEPDVRGGSVLVEAMAVGGWTGLVSLALDMFGRLDAKNLLELERKKLTERLVGRTIPEARTIRPGDPVRYLPFAEFGL